MGVRKGEMGGGGREEGRGGGGREEEMEEGHYVHIIIIHCTCTACFFLPSFSIS